MGRPNSFQINLESKKWLGNKEVPMMKDFITGVRTSCPAQCFSTLGAHFKHSDAQEICQIK